MQKEFLQAYIDWPVNRTIVELRKQAEDVEKVYNIFVVDDSNRLLGVLSLKRLLFSNIKTKISDYISQKTSFLLTPQILLKKLRLLWRNTTWFLFLLLIIKIN